ncbi:MAG: hypothetical protein SF097_14340 [Acidobacteriota bacterium]|nr:hypothetical protein [Acidobacteriota bacterium]
MNKSKKEQSNSRGRSRRVKTNKPSEADKNKGNQEQRNSHPIQPPSPLVITLDQRSIEQIATAITNQEVNQETQTATALANLSGALSDNLLKINSELSKPPRDRFINRWLLICNLLLAAAGIYQAWRIGDQIAEMRVQTTSMNEQVKISKDSLTIASAALKDAKESADAAEDRAERITKANESLTRAAEESASIASRAFAYGERPDVFIKAVSIKGDLAANTPVFMELVFSNAGKTAYKVTTTINYALRPTNSEDHILKYNIPTEKQDTIEARIASNQEIPASLQINIAGMNEVATKAIINDSYRLYLYGQIRFEDGLRKQYTLPFCFRYYGSGISKLALCANDMKAQ